VDIEEVVVVDGTVVEIDVVVGIDVEVVVDVVVPVIVVEGVVVVIVEVGPPDEAYSSAPISHAPVLGLLFPALSAVPICEARFTPAPLSGEAAVNERL
jgi:hypothetical protein